VASAGAGLGTTAFFSDEETFENNVLTAGALDLTVDWEEHYSDWSDDESENLSNLVLMSEPSNDDSYVPFPTPIEPVVWIHEDDIDQFMDNTTLESYPDADNDRIQDDLTGYVACDDFAQLPENLDPTDGRGSGVRSANEDTILNYGAFQEDEDPKVAPLVNLDDVKPGDFGELTLSLHLCDNPGYIWMQGELVEARENGQTEPEAEDPDEVGGPNSTDPADVELLDEIRTMLWYDEDGDNVYEPGAAGGGEADIVIVMDRSGSMTGNPLAQAKNGAKLLVDAVGPNVQVGLVSFASDVSLSQGLTTDKTDVKNAIDSLAAGGTTNIEGGVDAGREELTGANVSDDIVASGNNRNVPKYMVVLSDGAPNVNGDGVNENDPIFQDADPADNATAAKDDDINLFTIAYNVTAGSSTADLLEEMASDPKDSFAYLATDIDEIEAIFGQIGLIVAGEECFFQGSLRTLLDLLTPNTANGEFGIPLDGNRATSYDEVTGDDDNDDGFVDSNYGVGTGDDPNRDCFVNSTTNAIGLAWWLPVNHANEIQTDSVSFDLGFYTEQCRHNDGSGQAPETPASST
jgi:predicted ribosomally synthesized peptide with SipW-like signal peptide